MRIWSTLKAGIYRSPGKTKSYSDRDFDSPLPDPLGCNLVRSSMRRLLAQILDPKRVHLHHVNPIFLFGTFKSIEAVTKLWSQRQHMMMPRVYSPVYRNRAFL